MQLNDAPAMDERASLDWGELFRVMDYPSTLPEVKPQQPTGKA